MIEQHEGTGTPAEPRKLRPLRRLGPYLRPRLAILGLAALALLVAAGATLSLPVAVRYVIDLGFSAERAGDVDRYFVALFSIAAVLAIATAARFYLVSWLGERVVADLRSDVYAHVMGLSPVFFETTRTGEVLSRITTDTTVLQSLVGSVASVALRNTLLLAGGLLMLAITSPRLIGSIVVLIPLILLPIVLVGRRVRRLSRSSQDRVADASAVAGETLNAMPTVQAYTHEQIESRRFAAAVETAFQTAVRRIRTRSALTAIAILFVFGAMIFGLWRGAHAVLAGQMTPGELGQFVMYAVITGGAAAVMSEVWGEVQRAAGATERIMELLDAVPAIHARPDPVALPEPALGTIAFHAVQFAYPSRPDHPTLQEFSLDVRAGETVALVGPSGAGKTTVFRLLLRFYDPQSGRVELDGIDIARAHPQRVRERIGIVPQETIVFSADAYANIRYGRPDATDDEVRDAARAAVADEFLERLPDGYRSFLGERGVRLSGGQQQRIAIARAILKNPPVLLLDEATSALDAESERLVQEALDHLMADRTTIVIAHRLATVLKSDRIVVMDQGSIVDVGTHTELTERCELYAKLAALQFGETHGNSLLARVS